MHRIDTPTAQKDKFGLGKNGFTDGDPTTGTPATDLNEEICDALQEEVCTVIENLGIRLDKNQHDQLYQAIQKLSEKEANKAKMALVDTAPVDLNTLKKIAKALGNDPKFAETCNTIFAKKSSRDVLTSGRLIVTGGVDSKAPALQVKSTTTHGYLELIAANGNTWRIGSNNNDQRSYFEKVGKFSIYFPEKAGTLALISDVDAVNNYPVGAPIPWPQATPPKGYLICNGDPFDKVKCPKLALAYPSGRLPDLRGYFIRGWDAGRDVDPDRVVLSYQEDAIRNITGRIGFVRRGGAAPPVSADGAFGITDWCNARVADGANDDWGGVASFDPSRVVPTANENRPRNIAFNYIVREA
ncbi:phage tail protein [Arsenophonus nasoniae]|uniref:phage tail protein n=1 Tax=Arsenophonus nasoniae TaxID=638 RepID=UPI000427CF23|nr:phage tail protein [Arsenophonus nasoniae]